MKKQDSTKDWRRSGRKVGMVVVRSWKREVGRNWIYIWFVWSERHTPGTKARLITYLKLSKRSPFEEVDAQSHHPFFMLSPTVWYFSNEQLLENWKRKQTGAKSKTRAKITCFVYLTRLPRRVDPFNTERSQDSKYWDLSSIIPKNDVLTSGNPAVTSQGSGFKHSFFYWFLWTWQTPGRKSWSRLADGHLSLKMHAGDLPRGKIS